MKDGYWLGQDYPGIYLGEKQALNEDYTNSGFDRGHLNPNGHHPGRKDQILVLYPWGTVGGAMAPETQETVFIASEQSFHIQVCPLSYLSLKY